MADRGMGALEYRPVIERTIDEDSIDLAQLYKASYAVYEGETASTLDALRLAGPLLRVPAPKSLLLYRLMEISAAPPSSAFRLATSTG